jgi:hypothetical protein
MARHGSVAGQAGGRYPDPDPADAPATGWKAPTCPIRTNNCLAG